MNQKNCQPCQGIQTLTPVRFSNVPGQTALRYRNGTYAEFFESMLAALSKPDPLNRGATQSPLRYLTAREQDDPSIAFLDAWAVLADIMTFYNERYVQEGFLRTATQKASLYELANQVGYTPRPGVSATVHLAFEVDNRGGEVLIPAGTPAQSTPLPGRNQLPQTFETSTDLLAQPTLNSFPPQLTIPHDLRPQKLVDLRRIYLKGLGHRISPNDIIAIGDFDANILDFKKVIAVEERRASVQGAVTVLTLELSNDSADVLIDTIVRKQNLFFGSESVKAKIAENVLSGASVGEMDVLKTIRSNARKQGYISADIEVEDLLIGEWLNGGKSIVRTKAIQPLHDTFLRQQSTFGTKDFKAAVGEYRDRLGKCIAKIDEIVTVPVTDTTLEEYFYDKFSDSRRLHGQVVSPTPPLPKIFAGRKDPLVNVEEDVKVVFAAAGIDTPDDIGSEKWTEVQKTLDDFSLDVSTASQKEGTLFFAFLKATEPHVKAVGIVHVATNSNVDPVVKLTSKSISVHRKKSDNGAEYPIDSAFTFDFVVPESPLSVTVHRVGKTLDELVSRDNLSKTQVIDFVRSFAAPVIDHATFVITLKKDNSPIGLAMRTVVVEDDNVFLRKKLAEALNGRKLDDCLNEIKSQRVLCVEIKDGDSNRENLKKHFDLFKSDGLREGSVVLDDAFLNVEQGLKKCGASVESSLRTWEQDWLFIKELLSIANQLSVMPVGNSPDLTTFNTLFDQYDALVKAVGIAADAAKAVVDTFFAMVLAVANELMDRRCAFGNRMKALTETPVERLRAKEGNTTATNILKTIDEVFEGEDGIRKQTDAVQLPANPADAVTAHLMRKSKIQELFDRAIKLIGKHESEIPELSDVGIDEMISGWKKLLTSYKTTVEVRDEPRPSIPLPDVIALLNQSRNAVSALSVVDRLLDENSALWPQVLAGLNPGRKSELLSVLKYLRLVGTPATGNLSVWVFRSQAPLFGWNSPGIIRSITKPGPLIITRTDRKEHAAKIRENELLVDGKHEKTVPRSPIGVSQPDLKLWATGVAIEPHTEYGISSEATQIFTTPGWNATTDFNVIRKTKVFCDAEQLDLAESDLSDDQLELFIPASNAPNVFVLDEFHPYLTPGMKVVISGIQTSHYNLPGLPDRENKDSIITTLLVTIAEVTHLPPERHGEKYRTKMTLTESLNITFWRNTVRFRANIVTATHGETIGQVLGSGDARLPFQSFRLSRAPLTRLLAPRPGGCVEAIQVSVNDTTWTQVEHLLDHNRRDEVFEITGSRNDDSTSLQFGDGFHGMRLPTGVENVRSLFRTGLGTAGNVEKGQINQLPAPPFGVKAVNNPRAGTGGADPDTIDQTRLRIPGFASSMNQLVSLDDYRNFALQFAGISKAAVSEEHGSVILTVAGSTPAPLTDDGELIRTFYNAMKQYGDPDFIPLVRPHEGVLVFLKVCVQVDPRHDWDKVKLSIERAILTKFGYVPSELGRDLLASEVLHVIQNVEHVKFAEFRQFFGLSNSNVTASMSPKKTQTSESSIKVVQRIVVLPHEVCYVDEDVTSTIQLERCQ